MKKFRIAAILLAATLAVLSFAACSGASGTQTTGSGGSMPVLRVGMECAYAPFNWTQNTDENGAVPLGDGTYAGGYDVEIAKLLAAEMGYELQIVRTSWDGLPPSLTSGTIDAIIAGMSNTEERRATLDFTDDYYVSDLVVVVNGDSPYANATSLADFAGAKITGQMGTFHYDLVDQIEGVDKQPAMEDFPTMIIALTSGSIDGYVSERPGAISAITSNPSLSFVGFEGDAGFEYGNGEASIAIGIRQGEEDLKAAFNAALATISAEQREQLMTEAVQNQPLSA